MDLGVEEEGEARDGEADADDVGGGHGRRAGGGASQPDHAGFLLLTSRASASASDTASVKGAPPRIVTMRLRFRMSEKCTATQRRILPQATAQSKGHLHRLLPALLRRAPQLGNGQLYCSEEAHTSFPKPSQ